MNRRVITSLLVILFAIGSFLLWKNHDAAKVFAVGDLAINWGVPTGNPIFVVTNMLPGDTETRQVIITNNATVSRPVAVRGDKLSEIASFSGVLDFRISDGVTDLYGGTSPTGVKTLANFFAETATPSSVPLSIINPGATKTYTFRVHFDPNAGNEYQKAQVIFNIIIGINTPIPAECKDIKFSGPAIFGTQGNDEIYGKKGNDLIFGLEGNDKIFGQGGDDCIVGGPGNDELRGETGNDIIFGNEGNDLIVGGVGKDLLFGGDGNDTIRGENGQDTIYGGNGNDTITGGNDDDLIHGDAGDDTIAGENGNDKLYGDDGNDKLDGGNGNDTIIGGNGSDSADGKSGTDTCDAETKVHCEI
jgi:hypothetical protein